MAGKFRIYSTEVDPTPDPDNLSPAPATLIVFDQDPFYGEYKSEEMDQARGRVFRTLGGIVVQDFGVAGAGAMITFYDADALEADTVAALRAAYETVDGQFYFTDGYECWQVRFTRNPAGFTAWRNILAACHNTHLFSYTIHLLVISKEI